MTEVPPAQDIAAGSDLLQLASRLLAEEIDAPLYRALLTADSESTAQAADALLIDDEIRGLEEERALEELATEFCRLFVGPLGTCPPYESLHRAEATLGGRAERRIKDFMSGHGLEAVLPPGLPVLSYDHLSVELAVLHRLCTAAQPGAHAFLDLHLLPWAPDYLMNLHSVARLAPYRTIAELTARFLTAQSAQNKDHQP